MNPRRAVLLTTMAAMLATASPAFAASGLSPAQTISGNGSAVQPQVAVGAGDRTLVVWNRQGKVFDLPKGTIDARLGKVGGSFAATQTLSGSGDSPVAAVGADSVAAVAWGTELANRRSEIFVRIARAGHNFGRAYLVTSGVGVGAPAFGSPAGIEVQPDGRVVVVWTESVRSSPLLGTHVSLDYDLVEPSGRQTRGTLGYSSGQPSIAETADGTVLVGSSTPLTLPPANTTPADNSHGQVAALGENVAGFTAQQAVLATPGDPDASAIDPQVVAGAGGAGVAAAAQGITPNVLELAQLLPGGGFGPPFPAVSIDIASGLVGYAGPAAALPGDGAQVVGYTLEQIDDPSDGAVVSAQVMAAVRPAGAAAFGASTQLSSGPAIPSAPLAASAGSSSVILWGQSAGCAQQIYAAVRPGAGTFAPGTALAPSFTTQKILCHYANNTQLAIAGAGPYLVAGWLQGAKVDVATLAAP